MNIGNNFGSFNSSFSLNRNLLEGVLPQTASVKNIVHATSPNSVIEDEYIPSVDSALVVSKNKIGINETKASYTENIPTIAELEKILVSFLKKNSSLSYNQMVLEIDGNGKFITSDHVVFSINQNSEGNAELTQKYLDELNNIKVGDKSLGEAFLAAYAEEFGVDLNATKAEGREIKSLLFNFAHGIVGDKFVSQSTARTLHIGDTFYGIDDSTQEKIRVSESLGNAKLGEIQNDLLVKTQNSKAKSKLNESISFKSSSFMTNILQTQQASSPMLGMMQDLNDILLEGTITRVLESYNVELKDGDTISMSLNGKGEFSINTDNSSIWGASGEEIEGLCYNLENALNKVQTENGNSLGKTLLEQFSADMGFDLAEARKNENFSISFSFRYNSKIGKNEIFGAKQVQMNSLLSDQLENEESYDKLSMPFQFATNKSEKEIDQILTLF
jgi:hypothetical protein